MERTLLKHDPFESASVFFLPEFSVLSSRAVCKYDIILWKREVIFILNIEIT
jgi:hypothetical protein